MPKNDKQEIYQVHSTAAKALPDLARGAGARRRMGDRSMDRRVRGSGELMMFVL